MDSIKINVIEFAKPAILNLTQSFETRATVLIYYNPNTTHVHYIRRCHQQLA